MLIGGAAALAAVATGIEWMPRLVRRTATDRKLGVSQEPELRGELLKTFAIAWLCRAVQLGLIGVAVFTRPSGIEWVPIVVVFVVSLAASFTADATRRNLLA